MLDFETSRHEIFEKNIFKHVRVGFYLFIGHSASHPASNVVGFKPDNIAATTGSW